MDHDNLELQVQHTYLNNYDDLEEHIKSHEKLEQTQYAEHEYAILSYLYMKWHHIPDS